MKRVKMRNIVKGSYALLISLDKDEAITVGSLGTIHFSEGCHIYIGSAMNGIKGRVRRHRREQKKLHWHIDYFLKKAEIVAVYLIENEKRLECTLAEKFGDRFEVIPRFGSSDCNCKGHLFYGDCEKLADCALTIGMKEFDL